MKYKIVCWTISRFQEENHGRESKNSRFTTNRVVYYFPEGNFIEGKYNI